MTRGGAAEADSRFGKDAGRNDDVGSLKFHRYKLILYEILRLQNVKINASSSCSTLTIQRVHNIGAFIFSPRRVVVVVIISDSPVVGC